MSDSASIMQTLERTRTTAARRCRHCRSGRAISVETPEPQTGWIYHAADTEWTDTDCRAEELYRLALSKLESTNV